MSLLSTTWNDFIGLFTQGFTQAALDKLVADIQTDVQVGENDLALAGAWIVGNGPALVTDAQTFVAVLGALTGNLTIPAGVISAINLAIGDLQQFIGAVGKVTTPSAEGIMSAFSAVSNETPAGVLAAYKAHQAVIAATAAARLALASAQKK
jgi:hypothetical protein